jgi:hypothetical protein
MYIEKDGWTCWGKTNGAILIGAAQRWAECNIQSQDNRFLVESVSFLLKFYKPRYSFDTYPRLKNFRKNKNVNIL